MRYEQFGTQLTAPCPYYFFFPLLEDALATYSESVAVWKSACWIGRYSRICYVTNNFWMVLGLSDLDCVIHVFFPLCLSQWGVVGGQLARRGDGFINAVCKYNADGLGEELSRSIGTSVKSSVKLHVPASSWKSERQLMHVTEQW